MLQPHFLLVAFPIQGHINPALQFAKLLVRTGARVTLTTCISAQRRMAANTIFPDGLSFAPFSDGYDDGMKLGDDHQHYLSELRRRGSQALHDLILSRANEGKPFTCLLHTLLLPWASKVARAHHLTWALLWIQPANVFDIYYYHFNGYDDVFGNCSDPSHVIELPGLPPLTKCDLPSFITNSKDYPFVLPLIQEQIEEISGETNPRVLINTFDALEPEALKALETINLFGIGPLIPSAFLDGKYPSDTCFGGDIFHGSKDYIRWLDTKPKSSVVYVSFGSILVLPKRQMEEIARGLLDSGRPFLWVMREEQHGNEKKEGGDDELSGYRQELEKQGKIVAWCSQVEVLSHPSLGCFVTHCGWNSTLESLVCGVPVVAFPQWTDQGTNAKLIEDVWKTGVRVVRNEEGIVEGEDIRRCVDLVMGDGEGGKEMRMNAKKWRDLAREAVMEGGSSDKNLKAFMDEVGQAAADGSCGN